MGKKAEPAIHREQTLVLHNDGLENVGSWKVMTGM
jgi:hypothetical protein